MKKRIVSAAIAAVMTASYCGMAAADGGEPLNLITNGDFETALLGTGDTWTFLQKNGWYGATGSGTAEISQDVYRGGASSLILSNATAGQRVSLSAGYDYTLTAYVKGSSGKSAMINIDDGTVDYPDGSGGILKTTDITVTDSWQEVTVKYSPSADKEYVICIETWDGSSVYFDDVTLTGEERPFEGGGVINGDFSADDPMTGWTETGDGTAMADNGVLTITNPAKGDKLSQTVTNLEDGKYNLSVTAKTTDIDGIAYIYAKTDGHAMASTAIPQTAAMGTVIVPDITVVDGRCEIGVYAEGSATVMVDNFALTPSENTRVEFLKGGEISKLTYVEDQGGKFYREDGTAGDALQIMAENGFNLARIRLLDDPGKGHGDGTYYLPEYYMTEKDCLQLARRAKDKGMQILFSFAYSDYWVDGEKQIIPYKWQQEITAQNLSGEEKYKYLENKTYEYTKDVMLKLIEQGTCPEYVSIGNEIQVGLFFGNQKDKNCMWDSNLYNNANMLARFLNAGAKAVRETSPETKIILHSDHAGAILNSKKNSEGKNQSARSTFTGAFSGVDFDVIGVSYYPYYIDTVSIDDVVAEFNTMVSRYNKDVIIMETGYNWNEYKYGGEWDGQLQDSGYYQNIYGETQAGQRAFLTELYAKLKQVSGGRCIGDCYWDPVMIHDNAYKIGWAVRESDDYTDQNVVPNSTIFDFEGKAVEGQKAMKYNTNSCGTLLISGAVMNDNEAVKDKTLTFTVNGERYNTVTDKFGCYIVSVPYSDGDIQLAMKGSAQVKTVKPDGKTLVTGVNFTSHDGSEADGIRLKGARNQGVISYSTDYTAPRGREGELRLWAALYDEEGRLLEVKSGRNGSFSHGDDGGGYQIKAFLWEKSGKPAYGFDGVGVAPEIE